MNIISGSVRLEPVLNCTENGMCVLESPKVAKLPCVVARCLVEPKKTKVPIRLLNPSGDEVKQPANTIVASIEPVEAFPQEVIAGVAQGTATLSKEKAEMLETLARDSGGNLSKQQQEQFHNLLVQYTGLFAESKLDTGRTDRLTHEIHTNSAMPIRQAVPRIPPPRREAVQELLTDMLDKDVIQPSGSPWASPIVLVWKKDGSFRFCVDYMKLNEVTHKDAYPLPRIDDTLNTLAGSQWFSTLDLLSGYWHVEVAEKDRPKTAFCTTEGLFEFKAMPFG